MIRAVTFDVGGTLIQPWPSVGHVYAGVAARHGERDLPVETLNLQFAAAWSRRTHFDHSMAEWVEIVDVSFAGLTTTPPSQTFFPELYRMFGNAAAWRVYEDVVSTLTSLTERGLKLGIVSNWDERLRPLLAELKLASFFEVIIVSCEVGATKPDRAIFDAAIARMGCGAEEILHVGDSPTLDVAGSRAAGMNAVMVDRSGGSRAEGRLTSLGDTVAWIRVGATASTAR